VVPNHGSRWPRPAFDETTSVRCAAGIRKFDGGVSWLFELRLVRIVGGYR
jgi:hypothetical protein